MLEFFWGGGHSNGPGALVLARGLRAKHPAKPRVGVFDCEGALQIFATQCDRAKGGCEYGGGQEKQKGDSHGVAGIRWRGVAETPAGTPV
jgi:hypothetical protein